MDPFNRANHQSNAEQRRLKKAKAERAMRDIELYEEVQKLKNETAAISETVKKRKSHSMFLDAKTVELEEQNAEHIKTINRQKLQMKEKDEDIAKVQKEKEEQTKMVGTLQMEVKELKAKVELRDTNLEIKEEIIKMHEQKIGGLEEVQLAETNKNQQEKNDLHEEIAVLKETNQKQAEKIAGQGETIRNQQEKISKLEGMLITTGHVEQSKNIQSFSIVNPSQIQCERNVLTLADELAGCKPKTVFEKEAKDDKQAELELEKNCKLPAQKDSEGGEPQKLDDKHKEEQQQTEEGHQQKGGRNLPTSAESGNPFKSAEDKQKQAQTDEGEKEEEKCKDKMPAASVDIGNLSKNKLEDDLRQQHTDEGEGKEVEEKKENLPTLEDSVNPFKSAEDKQKQAQKDEGEKETEEKKDSKEDYEQNEQQQLKKTEEKQEEEESDGQMPVPTDEHTPRRRREESEVQQPIVIVHAQMVAQSAAAAAQVEAGQSNGCFRFPSCAKKTKKEQHKKSPPYCAAGKK